MFHGKPHNAGVAVGKHWFFFCAAISGCSKPSSARSVRSQLFSPSSIPTDHPSKQHLPCVNPRLRSAVASIRAFVKKGSVTNMRSFKTEDIHDNRYRAAGTFRSGSNHGPAITGDCSCPDNAIRLTGFAFLVSITGYYKLESVPELPMPSRTGRATGTANPRAYPFSVCIFEIGKPRRTG